MFDYFDQLIRFTLDKLSVANQQKPMEIYLLLFFSSLHSNLIISVLGYVANPRQSLIPTFVNNFEISNLNARNGEVRNFELDLDWHSRIFLSFLGLN